MKPGRRFGRADPFGLLIFGVILALLVTIGIQAQASVRAESARLSGCELPCVITEAPR